MSTILRRNQANQEQPVTNIMTQKLSPLDIPEILKLVFSFLDNSTIPHRSPCVQELATNT